VLTFVFAAFVAVVPLIIAAVSVNTAFLTILGLTYLTSINFVVQFLVGLIGLGVAIDYSLLLITRWREARGAPGGWTGRPCGTRRRRPAAGPPGPGWSCAGAGPRRRSPSRSSRPWAAPR
jgi:uncharacterized membrane protein YdfJ with MMPL/SSD domain